MQVELDVFSGRPNPAWEVPSARATLLLGQVRSSPESSEKPFLPDLGYRGFILHSGLTLIRVYQGQIIIGDKRGHHVLQDKNHIEMELASEARAKGYGSALAGMQE